MLVKLRRFENLIMLGALIGVLVGFFYVEELVTLKILAVILALIALLAALRKGKSKTISSKYELLSLLIIYLGIFVTYNFLYTINLPLYAAMVIVLVLITLVTLSVFLLDKINALTKKEVFAGLIALLALTILEVFLALYFLSVDPAIKSLFVIIVYYFLINLIYLYVNSMLRLKKVIGYLLISIIILAAIVISVWYGLS